MPPRSLLLAVALLVVAASAALRPAPAPAYVADGRAWPGATIAYASATPAYAGAIDRAAAAWNRAGVGVRFVRVPAATADVVVRYGGRRCTGSSPVGFGGRRERSVVHLGRGCARSYAQLIAVHELGHVLGLDHETHRCARMNPSLDGHGTPTHCAQRTLGRWLAHPLLADDVRGARALYAATRARGVAQRPELDSNQRPSP